MASFMSQVRFLLGDNPYYLNEDLYRLTNAQTDNEKTAVRMAKSRIQHKIFNRSPYYTTKVEPRNEPNSFQELIEQAFPPYKRLYLWQWDLFNVLEQEEMILVVVPRDHGKSVLLTFYIQYLLDVNKMDVLLLGWSAKVFRMAVHIYTYFLRNDRITDEGIVKNTTNHFLTKDGIRFDCFGLKEKAILGFHPEEYGSKAGLVIIVDDPMDESFEFYPTKERDLENRWESTIANINPTKLIISGTRKFEGDFLEYIADRYGDRISIFHRTPYNEDGSLLCPERWSLEKLAEKRQEIGEYRFSSEYLGDPQPITGGVWLPEDIHYASRIVKFSDFDFCIISVDPAWSTGEDSAFTSIEVLFRQRHTRKYIVFDDISEHLNFHQILDKISSLYGDIKSRQYDIQLVVAIESNGGGKILIDIAKAQFLNFHINILEVKHNRAKEERIMTLEVPIKNGSIEFIEDVKDSELIREILTYPKCRKFDAIDALSMAFIEGEQLLSKQFAVYRSKW